MTLPLQSHRRAPFALLAFACALLAGPAWAQDAELDRMAKRALAASISGMNLANDASSDIQYDVQPGSPGQKVGLLNERYFEHLADYDFVLKPGKNPSAAINSIFRGPTRLECNTMMISIEYRAIKAAIGVARFKRAFSGSQTVRIQIATALNPKVLGKWLKSIPNPTEDDLKPGDWVYFANHDEYLDKHPAGAWQGENAIYVGDNAQGEKLYSGFGVHKVTADEMNLELLHAYNAPRDAEDKKTALRDMGQANRDRLDWLNQNSIVFGTTVDEALAIAEVGLDLSEDEFEWTVIQDDPNNVLITVEYTPPGEDYTETVELSDMRGLVQCLRLDMESLRDLGKPSGSLTGTVSSATSAASVGLIGGLGR